MLTARIGKTKFSLYAFDLESHNDDESIKNMKTSMWLGCLLNDESKIDDENSYLYTMDEFLDKIEQLSSGKQKHGESRPIKNICIYIYNLSFEWSFILPKLIERGFEYQEIIGKEDEYKYNSVSTKSVSSVWSIELKFGKKHGKVIFRDLAKIYGGGLNKVAKSFNLETQKGEIDYRLNRLHGHVVTKEEKEYCFKDTFIIVEILKKQLEVNDKTFFQSLSMASYSMKELVKFGWPKAMRPFKEYRKMYPQLGSKETEFLRHSVSGGLTYATSRWQFKDIKKEIVHIDSHSHHPSSAYLFLYPYGEGEYHKGEPTDFNKINCCHIRISFLGVKLHSIIQLKELDCIDDYELWVWDFEIPTMKKCYENLKIEYIDYYAYKTKMLPWRSFYKYYFEGRKIAKEKGDLYNYLRNKLIINSSYGKSLEKAHIERYKNIIGEDKIIVSEIEEKSKPLSMSQEDWNLKCINSKYTYLPYGSCIPAYSRVRLVELALKIGWKEVVYFDTDSIFFIKTPKTMENLKKYCNLKNELGGWAIEETLKRGQFTAPKRYKTEDEDGKVVVKSGGINFIDYLNQKGKEIGLSSPEQLKAFREHYNFNFEEINITQSKWKVQRAFRCEGGTLICFQEKEISIPKKYIEIYKKNIVK